MDDRDDIFIVGLNITKHAAYFANKQNEVTRVVHGVYFRNGRDVAELFEEYGIRLANFLFQNAALTHSTAWYKKPVDGRVFVGGDYPYNKVIAPHGGDFRIAQSMVHPKLDDPRMYEMVKFTDGLGEFEMACATPEMTLIQLMDATKRNVEKHLPESETNKIVELLQTKYGSRAAMLVALEEIAADADKKNEFDRLIKQLLSRRRTT